MTQRDPVSLTDEFKTAIDVFIASRPDLKLRSRSQAIAFLAETGLMTLTAKPVPPAHRPWGGFRGKKDK